MTGPRPDNVQQIPEGYHAVTAWIISRDSVRLIEFLSAAFRAVFLAAPRFEPSFARAPGTACRVRARLVLVLSTHDGIAPLRPY